MYVELDITSTEKRTEGGTSTRNETSDMAKLHKDFERKKQFHLGKESSRCAAGSSSSRNKGIFKVCHIKEIRKCPTPAGRNALLEYRLGARGRCQRKAKRYPTPKKEYTQPGVNKNAMGARYEKSPTSRRRLVAAPFHIQPVSQHPIQLLYSTRQLR